MSITRQTFFYRGAFLMGLTPAVFGINALFRPEAALTSVDFPVPKDPESRNLAVALMRIYGIRNVVVSYLFTLVWLNGNRRLLGLSLIGALAMCFTDGLVSKMFLGRGEWFHWSFAPVGTGFVAGLLGYFD